MAHIFISYAREDETRIQPLVSALENQGWSVFWDRCIPAGQTWRSYIGKALSDASCIIVIWSCHSIVSNWVSEEAEEGKQRGVLVPVLLDAIEPPIGFRSIQAADMVSWDGTETSQTFQRLAVDVATIIVPASNAHMDKKPPVLTAGADQPKYLKKTQQRSTLRLMTGIGTGIAAIIITVFLVFLIFNQRDFSVNTHHEAGSERKLESVFADIYSHQLGFTQRDAEMLHSALAENGIHSRILVHRDPSPPDAIFIGALVGAKEARIAISLVPYEIKYIFRPDYPGAEGGDPSGLLIGIGYMSTHFQKFRGRLSEPVKVSTRDLKYLTEPGLSNAEFQRRLRKTTQF